VNDLERIDIDVWTDREGMYVCEWGGARYAHRHPFGLDSLLTEHGVPRPRNLHYIGARSGPRADALSERSTSHD
jgi:hypothetical protein